MSDAPPAAVVAATPAPGSVVSQPGTLAGPSASPVNAASSASKANQQAVAAEGAAGGTVTPEGTIAPATVTPDAAPSTPATLDAASSYQPSGNEHIDQITSLLHNSKFEGADSIINEVVSTQELSLTSKAKLVDELGNDVAKLVINQLESSVASVREAGAVEGKRLKDYAFTKFGGNNPEETWSGLQQFAQSQSVNLSVDDRKSLNEMLSAGGIKAELVIDSLFNKYKSSDQYVERPALMQGDETVQSNTSLVSKKQYQEQIGPAVAKFGESSQEVQALRQRRHFSLMKGYN